MPYETRLRDLKRLEATRTENGKKQREVRRISFVSSTRDDEWTFQQDGAPAHKAYEVQDWLRANCPDVITVDPHWRNPTGEWPPNSPDLNPMDYAIWSILQEKACKKPHPNVESLKRALKKAWNEITLETLIKVVDNFPKRLKACVDAEGGWFE